MDVFKVLDLILFVGYTARLNGAWRNVHTDHTRDRTTDVINTVQKRSVLVWQDRAERKEAVKH